MGSLCSISSKRSYSSRRELSTPFKGSRDRASAVWCLISALRTTSKTNSDRLTCHLAGLPISLVKPSIKRCESWTVRMIHFVSSGYGRSKCTAHTIVRHSRCVVSHACMVLIDDLDQYPTGRLAESC